MKRAIILVFGPSGVGKTTLVNHFAENNPDFVKISGGSLIKPNMTEAERDSLRLSPKEQILANQSLMLENFRNFCSNHPSKHILFDGHCLINNGNELVEIPLSIIKQLEPTGMVFIQDFPKSITSRRNQDSERPLRPQEEPEKLKDYMQQYRTTSEKYAEALNIPLRVLQTDPIGFAKAINSFCCL